MTDIPEDVLDIATRAYAAAPQESGCLCYDCFSESHRQCMSAALSALRAAGWVVRKGWQPIETAPRDASQVLVFDAPANLAPVFPAQFYNGHWFCNRGRIWSPTHWMPLPAPPARE